MSSHRTPYGHAARGAAAQGILALAGLLVIGFSSPAALAEEKTAAPAEEKKEEKKEAKKPAGILEILKIGKEGEKKEPAAADGSKDAPKEDPAKEAEKEADNPEPEKKETAKKEKSKKEEAAGGSPEKKAKEAAKATEDVLKIIKAKPAAPPAAEATQGGIAGQSSPQAEKKETPPPPRKKEPEPPMFRLRDGTRLAGQPDLKVLRVATPYGRLEVPVGEIVQIRFAALNDPQLSTRVGESIAALASEEFDQREEAMAALRKIGGPALEALKKAAGSEDEEVRSRAEKLVSEIEDELSEAEEESKLGPISGDEDEVVTLKFTAMGRVEEEVFQLATRYGALNLKRTDILSVVFQDAPATRTSVTLPGNTLASGKWFETKVNLTKGDSVHITASGTITVSNYGQSTGPEGTPSITGNLFETHPAGCLVGRIGDKGKAFFIGADYRATAGDSGPLRIAVAILNVEVTGNYQVEIEVEGGG